MQTPIFGKIQTALNRKSFPRKGPEGETNGRTTSKKHAVSQVYKIISASSRQLIKLRIW